MKKLLFVFPIVALLAAGCNSTQQASNQTPVQTPVVQTTNPASAPAPTPSPSTTSGQTAGWKTYQNTIFNYLINYPPNLSVFDADAKNSSPDISNINFQDTNNSLDIQMSAIKNLPPTDIDQYIHSVNQGSQYSGQVAKKIMVDGVEAARTDYTPVGNSQPPTAQTEVDVYHNGISYKLISDPSLVDGFISSWKFIQ